MAEGRRQIALRKLHEAMQAPGGLQVAGNLAGYDRAVKETLQALWLVHWFYMNGCAAKYSVPTDALADSPLLLPVSCHLALKRPLCRSVLYLHSVSNAAMQRHPMLEGA